MNNLLNKSQAFLRRNGSTILTCVGAVGVVATTVTAVKATPKAIALLENAKEEKGEELTKFETFKIAAPAYVPATLMGVGTLACIFGANILNKQGQASLMSAYALIDGSYKDYKKKVDEIYGEEAGAQVRAGIAKDKYEDEESFELTDDTRLYYDFYSRQYFEASPTFVKNAEYEFNRKLVMDDCVYLNEWYELLELPPLEHGLSFGWSTPANSEMYWQTWVDFHHEHVTMDDGLECTIISFMQDPYPNFEDYI